MYIHTYTFSGIDSINWYMIRKDEYSQNFCWYFMSGNLDFGMEKSWNFFLRFLWEPCYILRGNDACMTSIKLHVTRDTSLIRAKYQISIVVPIIGPFKQQRLAKPDSLLGHG